MTQPEPHAPGPPPAAAQPSPSPAVNIARRAVILAITGVSLYLLAPTLIKVFAEWPQLATLEPGWFAVMAVFQVGSVWCWCGIQRLALRTKKWFPVVTSNLAGGAFGRVVPGGGAATATLQYGMLVRAGIPAARVASGLTGATLLNYAGLLVLPVFAVPFVLLGRVAISDKLASALWLGLGMFFALSVVGAVLLGNERVLRAVGSGVQRASNTLRRTKPPRADLPDVLASERTQIIEVLGDRWWEAVLLIVGKWILDLFTLMAALAAVGARPSLVPILVVYCASQMLAQIPLTPGGLGFVEAGLTAMLALAGVSPADAVLATLAYRLFSYWLPLPVGLAAAMWHRRRYPVPPGSHAGTRG